LAERFGAFHPAEEKAMVGPYRGLPVPEGGIQESLEVSFCNSM